MKNLEFKPFLRLRVEKLHFGWKNFAFLPPNGCQNVSLPNPSGPSAFGW